MTSEYCKEMDLPLSPKGVIAEASRCLLCLDAPCSQSCPAGTDPAGFIRSVRFRNFKGAAETVRENNALGSVCARVCPTEKYCEQGCIRAGLDKPIHIDRIQRFITDFEDATEMQILKAGESNGRSIAIVGSGPSALQAAADFLCYGYSVEIFEKQAQAGGWLRYGIPEFRLPTDVLDKEISRIEQLGADIHLNTEIGKDLTLADLKKQHDAVILAVGASAGKTLPLFENNPYVVTAAEFLTEARSKQGEVSLGENVVVIGGGDVAMDVVTTLKKVGTPHVTNVVYEELFEFKASKNELANARAMGVTIVDGYVPSSVDNNSVSFTHRRIPGELKLTADKIVLAVGQHPVVDGLDLDITNGEVRFEGYRTEDSKVFVAGDIARGDKTVVWAVKTGKEVAEAVHSVLEGEE